MGSKDVNTLWDLFGDLPDFPGKKVPKNRPEAKSKDSVLDDRYHGAKGKEYVINGQKVILYTIGELAKALGKSPVTIRMWESKGWIPKTSYRTSPPKVEQLPGRAPKGRRLYSQEQLDILLDGMERYGISEHFTGDWEGFRQYIKDNWRK